MNNPQLISTNELPCCPEITKEACCERLQFVYRLENREAKIPVEIVIIAELERCPGPLGLGDVVYSTTLLPGEKVHLYTSSRSNRFTFDSESKVTYRHEQASEETYYMSSMDRFMSDLRVSETRHGSAESESQFDSEGSVSNWTDAIFGRPNVRAGGSFSANSTFDFMSELYRQAESSHERSVSGTRAANSISIGEVQSRSHAEGESESTFEAATRTIDNPNECHAVTYFAYQLVKTQTVRFRIKSVNRRLIDPAADTSVEARPLRPSSNLAVIPNGILATSKARIETETSARTAAELSKANVLQNVGGAGFTTPLSDLRLSTYGATAPQYQKPITPEERKKALESVDQALVDADVIDRVGGELTQRLKDELSFEKNTCLSTQALVIKGCLDECNVCERERQKAMELDLEHRELKNQLLQRQIELLEQSQEYRCCPQGDGEDS